MCLLSLITLGAVAPRSMLRAQQPDSGRAGQQGSANWVPWLLGTQIKDIGNTLILNVREVPAPSPTVLPDPLVTALLDQKDTAPKEIKINQGSDRPLERVLKAAKKNNKEFKVIILAEQSLPYYQLESILITCAMAGVTEINFKTRQGNMAAAAADVSR